MPWRLHVLKSSVWGKKLKKITFDESCLIVEINKFKFLLKPIGSFL